MTPESAGALVEKLKASAERADAVITVSNFARSEIAELLGTSHERIRVIYNGISPTFRPCHDEGGMDRVRAKYGIPGPYLLFVGNIEPRKNLEALVRAFCEAHHAGGSIPFLVIAGYKDWYFESLWEVVRTLRAEDAIIFPGVVDGADLPSLYSGAELFVFPSLAEGFGIPIIEAMACGTPVVASNTTSIPEIAADAALLVDPMDTDALVAAIQTALSDSDLRQALVEKGLRRAQQFSWERTAFETLDVYRKIGSR